jgi:acetyl-CoA carboxylase carboxyl transferase subunit alpha
MAREAELRLRDQLSRLRSLPLLRGARLSGELDRLQKQLDRLVAEPSDEDIWRSVELARHPDRPYTLDYVERLLEDWFELHGDRAHGDDAAVVAGLGRFRGQTVVLIGNQKGRDVKERTRRNFGMAYPEGYGKAMRAMELADRHSFPVLSLVDIPGAYPGLTAEQHGQGGAIARSQALMARLRIPVVTCVIGEGGSGGAIAIATANRVYMLEHSIYSVISPEGAASILWHDSTRAKDAATSMKITAQDLLDLKIIDGIIPEPLGGAHRNAEVVISATGDQIARTLQDFKGANMDFREQRREKYLSMGRSL